MEIDFGTYGPRALGRVAIIGAGDLGAYVAHAAANAGAAGLLLTGNSRMERVMTLASELDKRVPTIARQFSDLSSNTLLTALLDDSEKALGGPIDTFFMLVAVQPNKPFLKETPDDARRTMDVNFIGPVFFARNVLMRAKDASRKISVILTSSDNTLPTEFDPNTPFYDASKKAMEKCLESLNYWFAEHGSMVNAVLPGWIDLPSQKNVEGKDEIFASIHMGRAARGEEVALAMLNLARETHVSGTLRVIGNGGGTK